MFPVFTPHQPPTALVPTEGLDVQTQVYQTTFDLTRPLDGLMTWVLDRRNLQAAWGRVSSTDGADTPGPDGVVCSALKSQVGPWLARLADDLYHRRYSPQAPRWLRKPTNASPERTAPGGTSSPSPAAHATKPAPVSS